MSLGVPENPIEIINIFQKPTIQLTPMDPVRSRQL